jgi:hypothetical protein
MNKNPNKTVIPISYVVIGVNTLQILVNNEVEGTEVGVETLVCLEILGLQY